MSRLARINVNADGGVPKHRVAHAQITVEGVVGDRQNDLRHHGGPLRAVSLWSLERIEALAAEGHPVAPGTAGENLTVAGLDWDSLKPGDLLRVGEVVLELTNFAPPCDTIRESFTDGEFKRISQKLRPGWSRLYASVLRPGVVSEGDPVLHEPGVARPLDDLRPFFDAILAAPDDDAPRLRLADLLIENGDRRGESIRLACELEGLDLDDPARQRLSERYATLPCFYYFTPNPPWNTGFVARRGFVDEVRWTPEHFAAHGHDLMLEAPVRTLSVLGSLAGRAALLAGCPALSKLRKLVVPPPHDDGGDDLVTLGRSPHLAGLHTLRVENLPLDRRLLARLVREEVFPGLRALELINSRVEPEAWPELLRFVERRDLATLDITWTPVPKAHETLLRARLGARLKPPPVARGTRPEELRARVRFGKLDLSTEKLDAATLGAIVAAGPYHEVSALVLGGGSFGDAGVEALARSAAFPSLRSLDLGDVGITLRAARSLAGAVGLERLESVSLGDVVRTGADGRLADEDGAIVELARSPSLPSLREVHCGREWRAYSDGAREETVTSTLTRDDGRTVECAVHHRIWP